MTSREQILERLRQGVISPDHAADYFYKRRYPRRYRWLQSAPQRAKRCREMWRYGSGGRRWSGVVADLSAAAVGRLLLPLFAAHYRKATADLAAAVRAGQQGLHDTHPDHNIRS